MLVTSTCMSMPTERAQNSRALSCCSRDKMARVMLTVTPRGSSFGAEWVLKQTRK